MKVQITFDVGPVEREAIRYRVGASGLATYQEVRDRIVGLVGAALEGYVYELEYEQAAARRKEEE